MASISNSFIVIILIIIFDINAELLCEDSTSEQTCSSIKESGGENCYFNSTNNECITFNCGILIDEDKCDSFDEDYQCSWANIDLIDGDLCYTQCDKDLDIIFMVDTTANIIESNPDNAKVYGDFIQYLMQTWYFLNTAYQNVSTYFSLITFGTLVETQFDLNTEYAFMSNYIHTTLFVYIYQFYIE